MHPLNMKTWLQAIGLGCLLLSTAVQADEDKISTISNQSDYPIQLLVVEHYDQGYLEDTTDDDGLSFHPKKTESMRQPISKDAEHTRFHFTLDWGKTLFSEVGTDVVRSASCGYVAVTDITSGQITGLQYDKGVITITNAYVEDYFSQEDRTFRAESQESKKSAD